MVRSGRNLRPTGRSGATRALGLSASLCAAVLLSGCKPQPGAEYGLPIGEAHRLLEGADLPPLVFDRPSITARVDKGDPARVTWSVIDGDAEVMRFAAELTPVSERSTRVVVSVRGMASKRFGDVEQRFAANPALRDFNTKAMEEQVAATLERRGFAATRVYPAMIGAVLADKDGMAKAFAEASTAHQREVRANIAKAYAEEAAALAPRR